MLDVLQAAIKRLLDKGASPEDIGAAIRRVIHGPAIALLVSLTKSKVDDAALELLKALFPAE